MDEINQIFEYLSVNYKSKSDADYFAFLVHSVEENYQSSNYHFASVALHMIYMGIVYHYIYGIFRANKKRFEYVLIGFHETMEKQKKDKRVKDFKNLSWHNFSLINESQIFQFYRAVGIKKDGIGELKKPVEERNDAVHANGSFITDESEFEKRAKGYLKNLEKIDKYCQKDYAKLYKKFFKSIKIKIRDKTEAMGYLEQDFLKEYGVNLVTIRELAKIKKKDYPANVNSLFNTLKDF